MSEQKIPQGYKQTEIGVIPEDWDCDSLESVCPKGRKYCIVDGPFGSNLKTEHYRKSGIPIITSGFVTEGIFQVDNYLFVDEEKFRQEKRSAVNPGDIVMAKIGARCGASAILPKEHVVGILSGNALKITIDESKHNTYFIWQLLWDLYTKGSLDDITTTGAQPAISMSSLKKYLIPLPPINEQTAIATALSDVDALICELEKLIAKKQAIKTATMQQLLTGKTRLPQFALREDGSKKGYKQSELGEIPEDWEIDKIGNVVSITTGDKNTQDKVTDGLYPFFVRSQQVEKINSFSFDGEAVLTAGDGVGTGKIFHYINGKFDFHQRVYLMHNFFEKLDGYYFYIFFSNHFYERIMSMTAKSSVDSVRREMIADMPIILPTKQEQTAIAKILSDMDSEIQALEKRLVKTRQIKQGMMQELLTGKTRLVQPEARGV